MAPSISETTQPSAATIHPAKQEHGRDVLRRVSAASLQSLPYPDYYLPHEDNTTREPPLEPFPHTDPGLRADPSFPHLLSPTTSIHHLSPYLGTELSNVQISELSPAGLDELALFVARRKVVVFRDQDLKDQSPERQVELIKHFGRPHVHPISVHARGYPEMAVIYRDAENPGFIDTAVAGRSTHTNWHSDVSYERQPPGTTFFYILDGPPNGGDTLFLSQVEAYKRLSPAFQSRLLGLRAVHSAVAQANGARSRSVHVRREPVESEHPLVRVHPVTGEKALYVNPGFTTRIVGYKKEESDALLGFLFDHLTKGADFTVRASYEPGTVVIWDNRVTAHSALPDFDRSARRHHIRLTPQAEVPISAADA